MSNGQLTADEARYLGRERDGDRRLLNIIYGTIRESSARGANTLDWDSPVSPSVSDDLTANGFHVVVLPWKTLIRWL